MTTTEKTMFAGLLSIAFLSSLSVLIATRLEQEQERQPMTVLAAPVPAPAPERFPAKATWYGRAYHGRKTASGERFDMEAMTAAHPTLPFGTVLLVTWLDREVLVRITDRPAAGVEVLDLSAAAFRELAPLRAGVLHVVCEVQR